LSGTGTAHLPAVLKYSFQETFEDTKGIKEQTTQWPKEKGQKDKQ
jgi:hypothetical protein